jgi:hypothetical protein
MSYNMMIGYDIYDRFTIEHFPLRQSMILTTSFFCSRQYTAVQLVAKKSGNENFPNVNLILSVCQLIVYLTIPCNGLKRPILDKKFQSRDFCVEGSFVLHAETQF